MDSTIIAALIGIGGALLVVLGNRFIGSKQTTITITKEDGQSVEMRLKGILQAMECSKRIEYHFDGERFTLYQVLEKSMSEIINDFGPIGHIVYNEGHLLRLISLINMNYNDKYSERISAIMKDEKPYAFDDDLKIDVKATGSTISANAILAKIFADLISMNVLYVHSWAVDGSASRVHLVTDEGAGILKAIKLRESLQ